VQPVLIVHHQQLMNPRMFGEEPVGFGNRVAAQFLLVDGVDLLTRCKRLGNLPLGIPVLDHVARQQTHQFALTVHHRKRAERKPFLRDQIQHISN